MAGGRLSRCREKVALAMEHVEIKIVKDQMEYEVARDHQKGLDNASELWGVMDEDAWNTLRFLSFRIIAQ